MASTWLLRRIMDVSAAVASLTRVMYRLHQPRDSGDGSECETCLEPWPCQSLRDFERTAFVIDGPA